MDDARVRIGDVVAEKYVIERVLGRGGMGLVVAARHQLLEQRVAIKFLLPDAMDNPAVVQRFTREAQAAARIRSEHVARVFDVGTLDSGVPYIVLEYLDGQDLAQLVHDRGALPVEQVVDLVLQASEALAEAHRIGIVHRDLKPANLFLTQRTDGRPCVKVLDFGISKLTDTTSKARLTAAQESVGSPWYMSPEQLHSVPNIDARADIWSLGVILYELLCGRVPFEGDSLPVVCTAILTRATPRLTRPGVPEGVQEVVNTCLRKDRAERFATLVEFAAALAPFGSDAARASLLTIRGVAASRAATPLNAPAGKGLTTPMHVSPLPRPRSAAGTLVAFGNTAYKSARLHVSRTSVAALGGVAVLGVVAATLLPSANDPKPTAAGAAATGLAEQQGSAWAQSGVTPAGAAPAAEPFGSVEVNTQASDRVTALPKRGPLPGQADAQPVPSNLPAAGKDERTPPSGLDEPVRAKRVDELPKAVEPDEPRQRASKPAAVTKRSAPTAPRKRTVSNADEVLNPWKDLPKRRSSTGPRRGRYDLRE